MELVLQVLENWEIGERKGRLTWSDLAKAVGFSRGTLEGRPEIKERYWKVKSTIKGRGVQQTGPPERKRPGIEPFLARIRQLEEESKSLRELISSYDAKWKRYEYNAMRLGVRPEDLDLPLPPLTRRSV